MKKALLSIMFIGAVGSFSYALTRAYFSDQKSVKGSRFTVGTLDLSVGSNTGTGTAPFEISGIGNGSDSGSQVWKIKNTGSLPGELGAALANVTSAENGCNDPESKVDTTCGNPGVSEGELGKVINASFYLNGQLLTQSTLERDNNNLLATVSPAVVLAPGQEVEFKMDWQAGNYGNEIQSDSLNLDLNFDLKQVNK